MLQLFLFALVTANTLVITMSDPTVDQIHIALGRGNNGTVTVAWASYTSEPCLSVAYGEHNANMTNTATADMRPLNIAGERNTHVATLKELEEGKSYDYRVCGSNRTYTFRYKTKHVAGVPDRHVIFGDMGASHAFSLCVACTASSTVCDDSICAQNDTKAGLISEIGKADMFLHVGDFAYNFDTDGGAVGDQFMRNIEQVAAKVPYMVSHGNHEDTSNNLAHYIERFRSQPSNAVPATIKTAAGETTNTLYFSWDAGLVHYIALSTEVWFNVGTSNVNKKAMLEWLEKDLIKANANRANIPWIVAHGHRDIYCSTGDDSDCVAIGGLGDAGKVRKDLEPLFHKYGLDLWINGHEHSYERTFPLYEGKSDRSNVDPKATIYIVTGAAGSPEMHEGFTKHQPSWSAYRSNTFGYSVMEVHNETHIHWQQIQTDPTLFPESDYGRVIDDTWIVQHNHGPFSNSEKPTGTAFPPGDHSPSRSFDHWRYLLFPNSAARNSSNFVPTIELIKQYRQVHGEGAWAQKEKHLLRKINHLVHSHGKTVYEDVRNDGSSDGAYFRWKEQH